jgi:carbonic anhydrase
LELSEEIFWDTILAVIAVFLKKGQSNTFLDTIWETADKDEAVDVPGVSLIANDLLPAKHEYYTFGGSLTTPPCSEGVIRYVLKEPVSLSGEQVNAFAKIYPDNARPIQPTNGREISGIEIVE